MTVIAMVSDSKSVALAADRQVTGSLGLVHTMCKIRKLTKHHKVVGAIATAGSARPGELFEDYVQAAVDALPGNDPKGILHAAHAEFKDKHGDELNDDDSVNGLCILYGHGYWFDEQGFVLEQERAAAGIGESVAMGYLWSRKGKARDLARKACEAACEIVVSCGNGVDTFEMERASE